MNRLRRGKKAVGLKQSRKAIAAGKAAAVYLAEDADFWVAEPFLAFCEEHGVKPVSVPSKKELQKACGVEVPTACAVLLKEDADNKTGKDA